LFSLESLTNFMEGDFADELERDFKENALWRTHQGLNGGIHYCYPRSVIERDPTGVSGGGRFKVHLPFTEGLYNLPEYREAFDAYRAKKTEVVGYRPPNPFKTNSAHDHWKPRSPSDHTFRDVIEFTTPYLREKGIL
jgi:hypothetical protein